MTTIRPNLYPQSQPRPQTPDSAKLAAQRAFFNAALDQAQAPTAAPKAQAAVAAATLSAPAPSAPPKAQPTGATTEQGQRILRPGSLLDIRV